MANLVHRGPATSDCDSFARVPATLSLREAGALGNCSQESGQGGESFGAGYYRSSALLHEFMQRHAEEVGGAAGAAVAPIFVEAHGTGEWVGGVERDAAAALLS